MIDDSLGFGILALAALVVATVGLAQLANLKASIEELKRRLDKLEGAGEAPIQKPAPQTAAVPPPLPAYATQPKVTAPSVTPSATVPAKPLPTFNWESILGVKLFAWIGGFAFFLGVVFFVKYAFENNWITPAMRIIAGAITGTLLIIVSLLPKVRRYQIPAQSLCATGVLILYADIYAAHAFYGLIPLTATIALIWAVTAVALFLALHLEAQTVAWLGVVAGFVSPFLFSNWYDNAWFALCYVIVLNCAITAAAIRKRWTYLILLAAIGSLAVEMPWVAREVNFVRTTWYVLLVLQFFFLSTCAVLFRPKLNDIWTIAAAAVAGWIALLLVFPGVDLWDWPLGQWSWHILKVPLSLGGLMTLGFLFRRDDRRQKVVATVIAGALALVCFGDWNVWQTNFGEFNIAFVCGALLWFVALFLIFASTPYFSGTKHRWPWVIAALAGPLQFVFAYEFQYGGGHGAYGFEVPTNPCIPREWAWLMTLAFGIPPALGVWYLLKKENVDLASGDSRLATQGAAVLAFVSLVFPVQFHREWITLGWAIEGVALILLFRWIPNRRLRAVALIVLAGAFVRLVLNPAVLSYHPRTHVAIWNWYLYAYGIGAICFFISAQWFGAPKDKPYEKFATPLLYSLAGIVLFLLMNIEIADYFSIGPTLTFSFTGNFARDMSYTIAWSVFAFCLLVLGIARNVRSIRLVAIGLLLVTFAKLFLHDLDSLKQLYRIGAFIAVAIVAIVASFVYQRFLLPQAKT